MNEPYFFGYGSLVNRKTHDYPDFQVAKVKGWRRVWQPSPFRPVAFLSVMPAPNEFVWGAIARVPENDWAALDQREAAYDRHQVHEDDAEHGASTTNVQIYAAKVPEPPKSSHPILLSYLDTVIQGFLLEHGEAGAHHFFETTEGWHIPIRNDRADPVYPRSQPTTSRERAFVDHALKSLSAVVE